MFKKERKSPGVTAVKLHLEAPSGFDKRVICSMLAACACAMTKAADSHHAFLSLGCALICWQSLRRTWRIA